ncbi:DUF2919 family protein [Alteromonas antoniana]|uniref:DUF2919 family protein n=1 Tax=Alteromonas antoniana TaxID=2803813 RepID=UPI001C45A80F|nr:DUF2919 family protein [Alteromonas antoniana]
MKTTPLKLPLHCYDEAGRITPPRWLAVVFVFCLADWLILIFSLTMRDKTSFLLSLFYPSRIELAVSLLCALPALLSLILASQRERLWKREHLRWSYWVVPLLIFSLLSQIALQLWYLSSHHWQFQFVIAARLLVCIVSCYAVVKSRHLRWMISDWLLKP